jgi:hypothetical protein
MSGDVCRSQQRVFDSNCDSLVSASQMQQAAAFLPVSPPIISEE